MVDEIRARGQPERRAPLLAHHQECLGAGAGHDAVEQMDRIGDRPRRHVLVERQRLLHQRVRVPQRVVALRDAELAEILPRRAVAAM